MSSALVDTDILIDFLRGRESARAFLAALTDQETPHVSVVSVAELYAGMRPSEEVATHDLIDCMVVVPITAEIAELAGRLKQGTKGYTLELDDCFIAATALIHSLRLATRNTRHYPFEDLDVTSPGDL